MSWYMKCQRSDLSPQLGPNPNPGTETVFQACHSTLGMLLHGCPQMHDAAMWNHTKDMFVSNS